MRRNILILFVVLLLATVGACTDKKPGPGALQGPPPGPGAMAGGPNDVPPAGPPPEGAPQGAEPPLGPPPEGAPPMMNEPPVESPELQDQPEPEPEGPELPVLSSEQAIPKAKCKDFCAICKKLVECDLGNEENYDNCFTGCLESCEEQKILQSFQSCLNQASDCAAMKKCIADSPYDHLK